MAGVSALALCSKCGKRMHYKEDFDKMQLWLACKCGQKERVDSGERSNTTVVFYEEFNQEEDDDCMPITKDVRCPHCGHGQAGFFEEWLEKRPHIPRSSANGKGPVVIDLAEDSLDSEEDEVAEYQRWRRDRTRSRRKVDDVTRRTRREPRKKETVETESRRALIFVCLSPTCGKTWEGD